MLFYRNEEAAQKAQAELQQYHSEKIDFSDVDAAKDRINSLMDERTNLGTFQQRQEEFFVTESEALEDENDPDDFMKELGLDPRSLLQMPSAMIDKLVNSCKAQGRFRCPNQDKSVLELVGGHYAALASITRQAKEARQDLAKNGQCEELSHTLIMDTNEKLFANRFPNGAPPAIGSYRSPYYNALTLVRGASWTPVDKCVVSEYMDELVDWYNNKSQDLHPLERAAILHIMFVRIHPFFDGNGRTARLLVNYELIKNGYPIITIEACEKKKYIDALDKAVVTKDITDVVEFLKHKTMKSEKMLLAMLGHEKEGGGENESK